MTTRSRDWRETAGPAGADSAPPARLPAGRRNPPRRRGAAYVFFLSTATLVAIIGLSALMVVRIQARAGEGTKNLVAARFYAQSAIELGFLVITADPLWWQNPGSGPWRTNEPIGDGTLSLEVIIAPDGDALGDGSDPALLIGTGVSGQATHRMQMLVVPDNGGVVISPGSWRQVVGETES